MDRMRRTRRLIVLFALLVVAQPMVAATGAAGSTAAPGSSETSAASGLSQRTIRALRASADGRVFVSTRRSTGVAGFVRVERNGRSPPGERGDFTREGGGLPGVDSGRPSESGTLRSSR